MTTTGLITLVVAVTQVGVVALVVHHANRHLGEMVDLCDRLCQRLQAPQAAVLEHDEMTRALRDDEYAPPAVVPDDDDGYWMSRERLADLAMQQEARERAS